MADDRRLPRSPELMSRDDSALLVVDVQDRLLPLIANNHRLVWNIRRLIDGAKVLGMHVGATEQYPRGLGPTTQELADRLGEIPDKMTFSCGGCPELFEQFRADNIFKVLVVGIEAHVCVQQTVMDLMAEGFRVYLAIDAISSRNTLDYETAVRRMDSAGATLTTTESVLFEWCDTADAPEFRKIRALVLETAPEAEE